MSNFDYEQGQTLEYVKQLIQAKDELAPHLQRVLIDSPGAPTYGPRDCIFFKGDVSTDVYDRLEELMENRYPQVMFRVVGGNEWSEVKFVVEQTGDNVEKHKALRVRKLSTRFLHAR
ncbi:MAG: hypothetical protein MMC23_002876 [Stictis urceolatum]|nr:hypothetical protein [Stictis urceolata]